MVSVKLSDVLTQYKDSVHIQAGEIYSLVKISNKGIISLRETKKGSVIKADKMYRIKKGSFMYSRLAAHTGSYGLIPEELDGAVVSNEMPVFEINSKVILPEYLLYLMKQKSFLNILHQLTKGMGRVRIKEEMFLNQKVSIHDDIEAQKQTIEDIDFKLSNFRELNDIYLSQIDMLKKLRQAILKEATEGRVTASWRKSCSEQKMKQDSAFDLLEKIKDARAVMCEKKIIRKEKPLLAIKDEEKTCELPDNWAWCRFGHYALFERGRFSIRPRNDKSCYGGRYPFIQIGSLNDMGDVISEFKQTLNEKGFAASKQFKKGTIAIAIVGGTIGNLGILGLDMCFPDSMVGVKPSPETNQDYILLLLRAKQPEIRKAAYQMAGQPNIKLPTLMNLAIPLPPLKEQSAIVERVNNLLAMINKLEKQIQERREKSEMLMKVVLKEAFAG